MRLLVLLLLKIGVESYDDLFTKSNSPDFFSGELYREELRAGIFVGEAKLNPYILYFICGSFFIIS